MSASETTIERSGRKFSAAARRPLYYLAGVCALFYVGLLMISVHDRDFMYPEDRVIYERLANICALIAAIGVIYLVAARTYRKHGGPMESTGFGDFLVEGGRAYLDRQRRRLITLGSVTLLGAGAAALTLLAMVNFDGEGYEGLPLVICGLLLALLLVVPTLGAPLFLCLPLTSARKLRRTHSTV